MSQSTIKLAAMTMVKDLSQNQECWMSKLKVMHIGKYSTTENSTIWLIIFVDELGTRVFGIIKDETIQMFQGTFYAGGTYLISNAKIEKFDVSINTNVHDRIQLSFTDRTHVTKLHEVNMKFSINYKIVKFKEIKTKCKELIDVMGFVTNVSHCTPTNQHWKNKSGHRRELTIINEEYKVSMEGKDMKQIAISSRMNGVEELPLEDIIDETDTLTNEKTYRFREKVEEICNKLKPWYSSCKNCNKSVTKSVSQSTCETCGATNIPEIPRYMVKLEVRSTNHVASIIMFGKTGENYIGCPVDEYIESINKENLGSKWYKKLNSTINEEYMFLIKLQKTNIEDTKFTTIVEEVQLLQKDVDIQTNEEIHEIISKKEEDKDTPRKKKEDQERNNMKST
ncbi:hypothetical protein LIER_17038 [Lithospermum erythrorhizon]|uniref:Replication factor A C-terminal domain-containing protein n=1 Tax=Lithospermum erythrorhizon TaxID=34254 RepID=A0AAV3Q947_LITER